MSLLYFYQLTWLGLPLYSFPFILVIATYQISSKFRDIKQQTLSARVFWGLTHAAWLKACHGVVGKLLPGTVVSEDLIGAGGSASKATNLTAGRTLQLLITGASP